MPDESEPILRGDRLFPKLTPEQLARIAARGRSCRVVRDEMLARQGEATDRLFVVVTGRLQVARPSAASGEVIASFAPGTFTGEANTLTGRRAMAEVRAAEAGEVIEVGRDALHEIIQTDGELSDLFMRTFILRRVALIAQRSGDVVVLGSAHCQDTLRIREFLTHNGHPYAFIDLDRDAGAQELLDRFHVSAADVPVVILRGATVMRNPGNQRIAEVLGFNDAIEAGRIRDVVVIGAGPAGLAAAVYAASEGLDVLVIESTAPGGQAGTSSRIENYLGFPTGISGQALAERAFAQAQKFGAEIMIARDATRLTCDRRPYTVAIGGDQRIPARAVVIATGARYRKLPLADVPRFEGRGLYYAATFMESQLCAGEEIIVVGGGNSAGQAAVFLAQAARRVHMLVRGPSLADSMSRYLIRRIESHPAIELHLLTEIVGLEGNGRLERVTWRNKRTGRTDRRDIRHVFTMAGAVPSTGWMARCVAEDGNGFLKTGRDLSSEDLTGAGWPLARAPSLLETTLPGVFAVGDVRSGSIKRVASAVGEGSIVIAAVHHVLAE